MISNSSVIKAAKEQVSCDLSGEAAILNLRRGIYYGLNTVGARIWDFIREPKTVNQILDLLLDEYDVEFEECEQDLQALLQHLAGEGLIEVTIESESTANVSEPLA